MRGLRIIAAAALLAVAACGGGQDEPPVEPELPLPPPPPFSLSPTSFLSMPGWASDDHAAALPAFRLSCAALLRRGDDAPANRVERLGHEAHETLSGTVADWRPACEAAEDAGDARSFWEQHFVPVRIEADESLFTGYFEPRYPARRAAEPPFTAPVLTRPDDLITVDLGAFSDSLKGRDVVGRVEGGRLVPYADAAEIAGTPPPAETLGYVDPNDLLFLQIQGSGQLAFPDGEVLRAGYAAKNGRAYVAVGRTLVREGHLPLEEVTMQSIADWLKAAPLEDLVSGSALRGLIQRT